MAWIFSDGSVASPMLMKLTILHVLSILPNYNSPLNDETVTGLTSILDASNNDADIYFVETTLEQYIPNFGCMIMDILQTANIGQFDAKLDEVLTTKYGKKYV